MNLYAALFLDQAYVQEYQSKVLADFPEFEIINDVHLSLCHMHLAGDMPDFFDCFVENPRIQGLRWDLFEGRSSPYVYLVLVIQENSWLKSLIEKFNQKFQVESINGEYHVSIAKVNKEIYNREVCIQRIKQMPKTVDKIMQINSMQIRERFCPEVLLEIRLMR